MWYDCWTVPERHQAWWCDSTLIQDIDDVYTKNRTLRISCTVATRYAAAEHTTFSYSADLGLDAVESRFAYSVPFRLRSASLRAAFTLHFPYRSPVPPTLLIPGQTETD